MSIATNATTLVLPIPLDVFLPILEINHGFILCCIMVTCALWGISTLQTFIYYMNSPRDNIFVKLLPLVLWTSDTLHQVLLCVGIYGVLVRHWCNETVVQKTPSEFLWQVVPQAIVSMGAQIFFAHRIWILAPRMRFTVGIVMVLSLVQFVTSIAYVAVTLEDSTNSRISRTEIAWLAYVVHAIDVFESVFFATVLIVLLQRVDAEYKATRKSLAKAAAITFNTGVTNSIFGTLTVILLAARPDTVLYGGVSFLVCPLYCNTVLANLNARSFIRGSAPGAVEPSSTGIAFQLRSFRPRHHGSNNPTGTAMTSFEQDVGMSLGLGDEEVDKVLVTKTTEVWSDGTTTKDFGTNSANLIKDSQQELERGPGGGRHQH